MGMLFACAHSEDQTCAGKEGCDVGSALIQRAAHGQRVSAQSLFPKTCRSRMEKLAYAMDVALKCDGVLDEVWNCLLNSDLWSFWECADFTNSSGNSECKEAVNKGCEEIEPKCTRCQTDKPMSNGKHGCLIEIFVGDSSNSACNKLDYSSGRYHYQWFGSGKRNYRFLGHCSEAEQKGGDTFTQHVMCPTPWEAWA